MTTKQFAMMAVATMLLIACGKKQDDGAESRSIAVQTVTIGATAEWDGQGYSGTIEELSGTSLSFPTGGTIKTINVSEGQMVSRGQVIATIDASTMNNSMDVAKSTTSQASDMVQQAQATYNQTKDAYDRMKILHDNGSLPEIKWIEVETRLQQAETALRTAESGLRSAQASQRIAQKGVSDTRLTAPTSGYVSQKYAEVGQNVLPGAAVVKIVQIDRVKVSISVPESEVSQFVVGQHLSVRVSAVEGGVYDAVVTEKGVSADPLSRSYQIKAIINNSNHRLLPGMVCEVTDSRGGETSIISVPAMIVQIDADNRPFVWTVVDDKAQKAYLTLGQNVSDRVQVIGGLAAGQKVIIEGQQKVSTGMSVKEI